MHFEDAETIYNISGWIPYRGSYLAIIDAPSSHYPKSKSKIGIRFFFPEFGREVFFGQLTSEGEKNTLSGKIENLVLVDLKQANKYLKEKKAEEYLNIRKVTQRKT